MIKTLNIGVFDPKNIHQASPYPGDNVFAKGLEKVGCWVNRFDYRSMTTPNSDLLSAAENFQPDIFWFGKAERIEENTICLLKKKFPKATFVKWAADVRHEPTAHDMAHNRHMDWFFGTFGGEYLKKHLTPNMKGVCSILTFTDSDFYKKINGGPEFQSDILWTGRQSIGDNLARNQIIAYIDFLEKTSKRYKARVFGIQGKLWLGYPNYLYYISGTKIGIGSNSFERRKYSSDRLGNYMACGTFYLTEYVEGIEQCFRQGEHLDWFTTIDELKEKLEYYLENDEERERIAKAGQKFVLDHFDTGPLVQNLLTVIQTGKKNYYWDDFYTN